MRKIFIIILSLARLLVCSPNEMFVQNIGNSLYIATKYNDYYDLILTWDKCMANDLYTFKTVALYENPNENIDKNVTRDYSELILSATVTDNIGPVGLLIDGEGHWMGGNHVYTDSIGAYKTAFCKEVQIIINDSIYTDNFNLYTDHVNILVENDLYYPVDLPTQNVCIVESVIYTVRKNMIEVFLEHEIRKDINILVYYGLQSVNSAFQQKILLPNSQYDYGLDKVNGIYSGPITDYPNVYKAILSDSSKTVCQEMSLDITEGLFANTDQYMSYASSLSRVFTSGGKTYFYQIRSKDLFIGESYYWKGSYSWYDRNNYSLNEPLGINIEENNNSLLITWSDVVGATIYHVYRSTDPYSNFVKVGTSTVPNFIDTDVVDLSNKYFYRVTAGY